MIKRDLIKRIDVQQNTDEWLELRAGRLTSSNLGIVMAKPKTGIFGEPAKKYAVDIAVERITGEPIPSTFSNAHMERGNLEEPIARKAYEEFYFCETTDGGFYCDNTVGCSPDFLVGDHGVGEIKSAIASIQFERIRKDSIDTAYKWQCLGNLLFTNRSWIDFISYCATYPENNRLFIKRMHKDNFQPEFRRIEDRIGEFMRLVDKTVEAIQNEKT